jgi:ADP-ribose 1''-phosphate phosphatase
MDNLLYKPGDLFQAKTGILAHACNCQGTWGAGIAAEFKLRFPLAFKAYRKDCLTEGESLRGQARFYTSIQSQRPQVYAVGCLFTSIGYGWNVDHSSEILDATVWP